MTNEQLVLCLKAKKVFVSKQIKEITDQALDFKQVRNYHMFMKLNNLQTYFNKISGAIDEASRC